MPTTVQVRTGYFRFSTKLFTHGLISPNDKYVCVGYSSSPTWLDLEWLRKCFSGHVCECVWRGLIEEGRPNLNVGWNLRVRKRYKRKTEPLLADSGHHVASRLTLFSSLHTLQLLCLIITGRTASSQTVSQNKPPPSLSCFCQGFCHNNKKNITSAILNFSYFIRFLL